ncbi:hypothetical protein F7R91_37790 [Streptomyces luteolifulvus]|uniref:Uncharacterized protein n=1 Tax=Streptomyces luteolifulvus TaxID=2615112 RepID=A0A6H9UPP6_9ACTN|nr:hypothetical protein [Streptomyces luteolifulvus]KAB1140025.1 hypothetical protein F7R91_37790 [Streptomyces luteolifulvus]
MPRRTALTDRLAQHPSAGRSKAVHQAPEDGGGADHARAELVPDAIDGHFGHQSVLAGLIEADLPGHLVRVDEVFALEHQPNQVAAPQAGGVHL